MAGADLRGVRLFQADLRGAHLEGADMTGADLAGAKGVSGVSGSPDDWTEVEE
ncbi:MAG: hypothetical protein DWI60_03115 [Chloroflexi bacterium]|nr:MAG: hypothetical protein DWI60_03115 [Chloroflexota bacterium]